MAPLKDALLLSEKDVWEAIALLVDKRGYVGSYRPQLRCSPTTFEVVIWPVTDPSTKEKAP